MEFRNIFIDDGHKERWLESISITNSKRENGDIDVYFAASLYIITGMEDVYARSKSYIHRGWIDFEKMLSVELSKSEKMLIALAGNFYNGGFFGEYTPWSIICDCNDKQYRLVLVSMWIRKNTINISDIERE